LSLGHQQYIKARPAAAPPTKGENIRLGPPETHPPRMGRTRAVGATLGGAWPCDSESLGAAVPSSYYEIRVSGVLPPEALLDFDRLTASVEPVETVVHGALQDQAALNGLLARLEAFGVQVIEVRRLHEKDQPAGEGRS
jgi:hypothetical protein